jgi:hypothetical protein
MTDLFPTDSQERKSYPPFTGLLEYFPRACAAVARHSLESNEQHNPGEPMRWAKDKSIGDGNQIVRHLMEGVLAYREGSRAFAVKALTAMAWRSLELLERLLEGLPPFSEE